MAEAQTNDGPRVLLIEDDPDIRASTTESLEGEGFAVTGAETVDEALAHLRRGLSPAVILLDLMMPGRNGWDFRKDQLADPELRSIPVVVITASRLSAESIRGELGDVEFVGKPFTTDGLVQAIARATSLHPDPARRP